MTNTPEIGKYGTHKKLPNLKNIITWNLNIFKIKLASYDQNRNQIIKQEHFVSFWHILVFTKCVA